MQTVISLVLLPILLLPSLFLLNSGRTTKVAPLFFWLHTVVSAIVLWPLLSGITASVSIGNDFRIDALSASFVMLSNIVVACAVSHAQVFFSNEKAGVNLTHLRMFYGCSGLFLLAMTFVFISNNLGLLWISMEATTLASAPFVFFHGTKHSLEAAWKYLIICSVGIAFALLGTMFVFASSQVGNLPGSLSLDYLITNAKHLDFSYLRLGFLFSLLGYGTKAGIVPLHSWLPDAHSEAPAPASAMLSGGLLNCALYAIFRIASVVCAAGHHGLCKPMLLCAGVVTVIAASIFLIRQHSLKRLFAYSSIENVGLMLCAIAVASPMLFLFLAINHSAAKVCLFLLSGNIMQATGTKNLSDIRGLYQSQPAWSILLVLAAFAVTGAPPFGAFMAEWQLLALTSEHHLWIVVIVLSLGLALSFLALTTHVGKVVCGTAQQPIDCRHPIASCVVPAALMLVTFSAGLTGCFFTTR